MEDANGIICDVDQDILDVHENVVQEYEQLNGTLDQLSSCLDVLEQKNDSLFANINQFLAENKKKNAERKNVAPQSTENKSSTISPDCKATTSQGSEDTVKLIDTGELKCLAEQNTSANDDHNPLNFQSNISGEHEKQ